MILVIELAIRSLVVMDSFRAVLGEGSAEAGSAPAAVPGLGGAG